MKTLLVGASDVRLTFDRGKILCISELEMLLIFMNASLIHEHLIQISKRWSTFRKCQDLTEASLSECFAEHQWARTRWFCVSVCLSICLSVLSVDGSLCFCMCVSGSGFVCVCERERMKERACVWERESAGVSTHPCLSVSPPPPPSPPHHAQTCGL